MNEVIKADASDTKVLSQVITEAFFDLPPSRWLVSSQAARRVIFPGYFALAIENTLANGVVQTTPERDAVALWLYVDNAVPSPPANYLLRLAEVTGSWINRFVTFDAALEEHHPLDEPHYYLVMLAVRPGRQGRGIGSSLLRAFHGQADQTVGVPCYLEAATEQLGRFYRRHHYVPRPGGSFCLAEGAPAMWPMRRPPRPPAKTTRRGLLVE